MLGDREAPSVSLGRGCCQAPEGGLGTLGGCPGWPPLSPHTAPSLQVGQWRLGRGTDLGLQGSREAPCGRAVSVRGEALALGSAFPRCTSPTVREGTAPTWAVQLQAPPPGSGAPTAPPWVPGPPPGACAQEGWPVLQGRGAPFSVCEGRWGHGAVAELPSNSGLGTVSRPDLTWPGLHPAPARPHRATASPRLVTVASSCPHEEGRTCLGDLSHPPHPGSELLSGNGTFRPEGPSRVVPEKCRGLRAPGQPLCGLAIPWGSEGHRGGGPSFLSRCLEAWAAPVLTTHIVSVGLQGLH